MNYKVMKRPMFRMGGKAASQGTGITSGLDEKVNMTDGRVNYQDGPTTYQDFLDRALKNYNLRQEKMADMNELINLQALGKVSNVLGQTESNNPLDILQNIAMSGAEIALPALSAKKSLELKNLDPATDLAFAKVLKPTSSASQKVFQMKFAKLDQLEKALDQLESQKDKLDPKVYSDEKRKLNRRLKLTIGSSYQTEDELRADLRQEFIDIYNTAPSGAQLDKAVEDYKASMGLAEGGRVNRAMGSGDDGELPADPTEPVNPFKPKPIKPLGDGKMAFDDTPGFELKSLDALINEFEADNGKKPVSIDELKRYFYNKYGPGFISKINQAVANESKDVAMETQGQGNNVYDMLRTRLPQEISDEVVKLIAYNKEAFGDFASIKNQEDVTSFNEKYGVELVIDVATV